MKLLNSESFQEYPKMSGQTRESRVIHAEVIYLFGGVEVSWNVFIYPTLCPWCEMPFHVYIFYMDAFGQFKQNRKSIF